MSILNYFEKVASKIEEESREDTPNITVRERQAVVTSLKDLEEEGRRRGKCRVRPVEEMKEMGTYAIKHGISKTVRDLEKKYPELKKKQCASTRSW